MKQKNDEFLDYIFTFSTLSPSTQKTYKKWVTKCCQHVQNPHVLDLTPVDISTFRLFLLEEKWFSPGSSCIVYAALKYVFGTLLAKEVPQELQIHKKESQAFLQQLGPPPKQGTSLPGMFSQNEINEFFHVLPQTTAGNLFRALYKTGKPLHALMTAGDVQISYSVQYLQKLFAQYARKANISHGLGLRGLRATGIVHRIKKRLTDNELSVIMSDTGLSYQQFLKYRKLAGDFNRIESEE